VNLEIEKEKQSSREEKKKINLIENKSDFEKKNYLENISEKVFYYKTISIFNRKYF